jgi:hypothetical protein
MTGPQWDEFLDNFHAIIKKCFTDLATLRKETEKAHIDWHTVAYPNSKAKDHKLKSTNCALAIVLKIYQRVGDANSVFITNDVNDFKYVSEDIYDYLDPVDVLEAVKNA